MRALLVVLAVVPAACGGAPAPRASTGVVKHRGAVEPSTCVEPTTLSPVLEGRVAEILANDPEAAPAWRRGKDDHLTIAHDARVYSMSLEGSIAATEGGKPLWKVPEVQVAGGAFGLMLSPKGSVVVRQFSRGGLELFDANDGRRLREVGAAEPSPDDRFVLELPRIPFGLEAWDHDDVRYVPLDPKLPVQSIVKLPLKTGEYPQFGATVCATGALFAVSFPTTALAVYRTSDLQRLASLPTPGPGVPAFTRSGRYLVLREHDNVRAMFELVR